LVNINNQTIIYNGLYYDHEISPDGYRLESLLISDVSRRFVNNPVENQGENKWYDIPGDYLLIPAGSIINMNVSYYNLNRRG
jgi:Ni/Co efflux regulator RcnB